MIDGFLFVLVLATALGCGLVAGSLFAFSSFVMKALARVPEPQGIVAMQSINVTAVMPGFMSAFVGSAIACAALAVTSIVRWDEPYGPYLLAGSLCYLVGTFGLTLGYHVPRNNALETIDPTRPGAGGALAPLRVDLDDREPRAGHRGPRRRHAVHARVARHVVPVRVSASRTRVGSGPAAPARSTRCSR